MLKQQIFKFIAIGGLSLFISGNAQNVYYGGNVSSTVFLTDNKAEITFAKAVSKSKVSITPLKKAATPNIANGAIGKPGPILSKTKVVNGKRICARKNDNPKKSKKNSKGHIDGECCLDPNETPNSLCYYPQQKYAKMIQKYLNSKK